MKAIMSATDELCWINDQPHRIWRGVASGDIPVVLFVRLAASDEPERFEKAFPALVPILKGRLKINPPELDDGTLRG